ncbi:sensor histidine kinase [Marinimicrobium sp. ARAG 43.8]|uniref:sensor histidine kinase n=1 Tax=Marinimicrobium sp. ARAG 43.8 TaxID=3418719 RepID=UPI003CE6F480
MADGASTAARYRKATSGDTASSKPPQADVVPLRAEPSAADVEELKQAFDLFGDVSQQLVASYEKLEHRVESLTGELSAVNRQREQELAEKEQLANRLENLLNFLPGGVVVLDSFGQVTECNPVAVELLGEPLQGLAWRVIITRAFKPRSDDGHEVSLHDGRRIRIATRNLGDDGQIILLTDLTETRRLQSDVSRNERLSALGKMVSALAHQIRTPLSAAMLYAGHLRHRQLDEGKREEFAGKLSNRLNHIERQVQDMLLFVKGELPLNDYVSVSELQSCLAEALEVPLSTSQSECEWCNDCGEVAFRCNREALVGALLNLANNSIQATQRQARLHIRFEKETVKGSDWLAIYLSDNGPGIDPELLPRVKELFITTKAQGTGLGLAVVQAVARAHGGAFDLQSTPGEGACATLLLPLQSSYAQLSSQTHPTARA